MSSWLSLRPSRSFGAAFLYISLLLPSHELRATVTSREGSLTIPTYGWAAVQHPYFRGTDGNNIYPYRMLDFLSREKTNRTYKTVELENEFLRITFLPELGGKIHEVINKSTGKPVFYVNHVIKPGLIGQCGAWTSGGVEWNTGPQGHTVSCMLPVTVRMLPSDKDGSRSVVIGETERIYGTRWTVTVTLRPNRSFIEERVRIYNPTPTVRPYYFWNCTASPNTPGFRFIYPMTLGCDHGGEKFFRWPIDNGKDLTKGVTYIDAASIFAWHCNQNFFGSYNDDLDSGVVATANHYEVPGKKAWTWGQGGFGKMHQMDLTDNDGPYNEVQTGPLLTQAQVGRLEPSEAVEWREWWYPVHRMAGFVFANKDVAVNFVTNSTAPELRILGTGTWAPVHVRLTNSAGISLQTSNLKITPSRPAVLPLTGHMNMPFRCEISHRGDVLASFDVPLRLQALDPPAPKPKNSQSAVELSNDGWSDYLFARNAEAERKFQKSLEMAPGLESSLLGLALLNVTRDPQKASKLAAEVIASNEDSGLAHLIIARTAPIAPSTQQRGMPDTTFLEHAWAASLDPATAVAGRSLAAKMLVRNGHFVEALQALESPGSWRTDPVCLAIWAYCELKLGNKDRATKLAESVQQIDPIDLLSLWILEQTGRMKTPGLRTLLGGRAVPITQLAAALFELGNPAAALDVIDSQYLQVVARNNREPLPCYWARSLQLLVPGKHVDSEFTSDENTGLEPDLALPYSQEDLDVLNQLSSGADRDPLLAFFLGSVLFNFGREDEAAQFWRRASEGGSAQALRALAMASKQKGTNPTQVRSMLRRAAELYPHDAIMARDLARLLVDDAAKAADATERNTLYAEARDRLIGAIAQGRGRSDFVGLLASTYNRLGDFEATGDLLDKVRVTVWEGAHEVHDSFVEAHLGLGQRALSQGNPSEALKQFNRALEYPENLATGKLENARVAHILYLKGNAYLALGQKDAALSMWELAAKEPESSDPKIKQSQVKARDSLAKFK